MKHGSVEQWASEHYASRLRAGTASAYDALWFLRKSAAGYQAKDCTELVHRAGVLLLEEDPYATLTIDLRQVLIPEPALGILVAASGLVSAGRSRAKRGRGRPIS